MKWNQMMGPVLAATMGCSAAAQAQQPNVVIIYADDMGYGDLQINYPESKIPTPNLDQLAARGMRFTDGHSSSGVCSPSRFAMLTGQHHWRRFHDVVHAMGPSVFKPTDFTLPKMFNQKGYHTACIGKWHLGWDFESIAKVKGETKRKKNRPSDYDWSQPFAGGPCTQGFDYYYGDGTINFPPYTWLENDKILYEPTFMMNAKEVSALGKDRIKLRSGPAAREWNPYKVLPTLTDRAVEWIGSQSKDEPFFLYLALPSPHEPVVPSEAYRGKTVAGTYGDYMFQTDDMAGRVLKALDAAGLTENTLIVFTADNGPERTTYNRFRETGHWSSGPYRGAKRDVWEGGHRVPFIVSWPGKVQPGSVSAETVSQVDLFATFADVIGYQLQPDQAIDSYNLRALWGGKKYRQPLRTATVQNTREGQYGLRQGDWMFINESSGEVSGSPDWYNEDNGYKEETTPGLLYNLKTDPAEKRNVYADYPEKVATMQALLNRYRQGEGCAPHATKH